MARYCQKCEKKVSFWDTTYDIYEICSNCVSELENDYENFIKSVNVLTEKELKEKKYREIKINENEKDDINNYNKDFLKEQKLGTTILYVYIENNQLVFFPKLIDDLFCYKIEAIAHFKRTNPYFKKILIDKGIYSNNIINTISEDYFYSRRIDLDRIEWYSTRGDVYRESKLSGGGSSIKKGIIGGIIAGGAGAIVASRNNIKSELITHDERETYLSYINNNGERKFLILDFDDYLSLRDIIPEKDYDVVSSIENKKIIDSYDKDEYNQNDDIKERLKRLLKLKEQELITENEYNETKKNILNKL